MTMLEKTIDLLNDLPESTIENVYNYVLYLKSDQAADMEPAHQADCSCPFCRIFRYPNKETVDAMEEVRNMMNSGMGQHITNLEKLFEELEKD